MSTLQETRQVLRRTRSCPELLRQLIDWQSLLPPQIEPPNILESFAIGFGNGLSAKAAFEVAIKQLKEAIPRRDAMKLYKWLGPLRLERQKEIFREYVLLTGVRSLLGVVADRSGDKIQLPDVTAAEQFLASEYSLSTTLQVTRDGRIEVRPGNLVELLQGIEPDRIRRCSECTRIFWAGRCDKKACSPKCINRRNVRLHREHSPKYKYQRYLKAEAASSGTPRTKSQAPGRKSAIR